MQTTTNGKGRDGKGRFAKGHSVNGRSGCGTNHRRQSATELQLQTAIDNAVTVADWQAVARRMLELAKAGDVRAATWLADRRFGRPRETYDDHFPQHATIEWVQSNWPACTAAPIDADADNAPQLSADGDV